MSVLLDIDPLTGAVETMDYDLATGKMLITRTQEIGDILDMNAAVRNDSAEAWRGADNTMWHIATVPLVMLQDWLNEFNAKRGKADKVGSYLDPNDEWQTFMWRRIQSSDFGKLKVSPKRV